MSLVLEFQMCVIAALTMLMFCLLITAGKPLFPAFCSFLLSVSGLYLAMNEVQEFAVFVWLCGFIGLFGWFILRHPDVGLLNR